MSVFGGRRLLRRGARQADGSMKMSALVASAQRMTLTDMGKMKVGKGRRSLQDDVWRQWNLSGELRTGVRWFANSLSRATLYVAQGRTDVAEPARVESGPAVDALNALFNGPAGQAQMLGGLGYQLGLPGEGYLVGYQPRPELLPGGGLPPASSGNEWVVASIRELVKADKGWALDRGDGQRIALGEQDWILRIWTSSPERWWWADSPTMGVLPVLAEMEALGKHVMASVDSRLAGAGILALPQEMTFPPPSTAPPEGMDAFTFSLIEAMTVPIQNRDSAAAVVPFVIKVPGELIKEIKHLSFATPLDERVPKMREDAIRRMAIGMDMPPEVLLGMGGANHWSAWQITDEGVKLHIEPKLATVCDALTTAYLWPLIGENGDDPDKQLTIWYDTTQLTERPDRGPDALTAFNAGELSGEALRGHLGFPDTDKPSDQERQARILLSVVESNPQYAIPILEYLGILRAGAVVVTPAVDTVSVPSQRDDDEAEEDGPPAEQPNEQPSAPEGEAPAAITAALTAAAAVSDIPAVCNLAVTRTLELVGKRLVDRTRRLKAHTCAPWEMHTQYPVKAADHDRYLLGAWDVFRQACPEYQHLVPHLDAYVRTLLERGVPHDPQYLVAVIRAGERQALAVSAGGA